MEMNQLQNSLIYGKVMWFESGFCLRAAPVALLGDLSGARHPLRGWSVRGSQ